jgi:hypothetical protein
MAKAKAPQGAIAELATAQGLAGKSAVVLRAISNGECSVKSGAALIEAMVGCVHWLEIDAMSARISALEAQRYG